MTDMTRGLAKFLNGNTCVKCAFVIPTYEISQSAARPANKGELAELVSRNKAQPFHSKIFVHNQFATNFSRLTHYTTLHYTVHNHGCILSPIVRGVWKNFKF